MGYNILLVADDRETKELLMLHLNSNGFTVDIAENEEMFNVCFGHQKANLILIDMMMKSLNIYELIRVIRLKSNLPIILIADKENDANRILGLNLGGRCLCDKAVQSSGGYSRGAGYVKALL